MWTTCFHGLFFTPEPSNVIILFFSSLHFCSLVVTASRRICHDPALGSNAFFHVYAAEMQRLVPVWTVPMASGADLHNSMLVFACWEGTLVSRQLLFAIRDSYWGRLHQPKVFFFGLFYIGVISGIRRARTFCRNDWGMSQLKVIEGLDWHETVLIESSVQKSVQKKVFDQK